MNFLFHKEIGLPKTISAFIGKPFKLEYTYHAKMACLNDRYGVIDKPPFHILIKKENIIEVETLSNFQIEKIVVRQDYDKDYDLVLALVFEDGMARVKTVWKNVKSDGHATLRRELYKTLDKSLVYL